MKEGGFLHRLSLLLLPKLIVWLIRIWFATCRVRVHGDEHRLATFAAKKAVVASFWHYTILFVLYEMRQERGVAMVSASRDGEYIARLAGELGYDTTRGSRNNKGIQALKVVLKAAAAGRNTAIVSDGSQGPPRIAQPGAILVSSRTGLPVVPLCWSASSYFTIPSWDRTAIPRPFSRVDYFYGEPLAVPSDLKADGIEEYRLELENRLNELYLQAWSIHGRQGH